MRKNDSRNLSRWKTSTPWWHLSFDELKNAINTGILTFHIFELSTQNITAWDKALVTQFFCVVKTIEKAYYAAHNKP